MAKKRSNGEGSLRKRTDGRWECTIMDGFQADGKRKYKTFYAKTQKEVRAKARQYQDDQVSGLKLDPDLNFTNWADTWFEGHKDNVSATTQESYYYTLRTLKASLGMMKLVDMKAIHVEEFLKYLREDGKSDSYIKKCRAMLHQIMHKAEANDLIRKNPVRFAEKMKSKHDRKQKKVFTAEEIATLMVHLPHDRMGMSIRLLLGTGMRMQELLGLEPYHIEGDGSVIRIRQAVQLVKGTIHIGPPKSRDSIRDIPVPEAFRHCALFLRNTDKRYIWETLPDKPCNPACFRRGFQRALSQIPNVQVLAPHSCRHTYVSQMQALGVDLPTIQSIVGHADIDMTQHYLHVQDSIKQSAIEKFSQAFSA